MSEFQLETGEELLEALQTMLGTEEGVKQWVKEFAEWVEICYEDSDYSADDFEKIDRTSSSETDDEESPRQIVVEEVYEAEVDENGFHSLKDVAVKDSKENISNNK